jgi:DNA replication protein DnaC
MEFWKNVRQQVLTGQLSQRAAMKQYGLGWHTLKKILAHDEPPGYRQRQPRTKRKLEPFLPIIRQILEDDRQAPKKQRHTAHRIFERLRDEHGYAGGETVVKRLDEFDFAARPSVNKPLVLELLQGEYLDRRENILLVGPSGTGKSHLATALGMAACAQGRKVRFFRVTELITLLLEAKEERVLLRLRQQLGKLDLLILDELGYIPASKAGAELLFDVIATAYERYSLVVTTNLAFENWTEVLGSERLTGAALDRLTHRCHILEAKGESYRLQDAKRRRRRSD